MTRLQRSHTVQRPARCEELPQGRVATRARAARPSRLARESRACGSALTCGLPGHCWLEPLPPGLHLRREEARVSSPAGTPAQQGQGDTHCECGHFRNK